VFFFNKLKAICNDITWLKERVQAIHREVVSLDEVIRNNDHFHIDNIDNISKRVAYLEVTSEVKHKATSQYQENSLREQLTATVNQLSKEKSAYQEAQKLIREYGKTIFDLSVANKELGEVNLTLEGRDRVQRSIIETLHYQVGYLVTSMKLMAVVVRDNPNGENTTSVLMSMAKLASDYIEQNDPLVDTAANSLKEK